MAIILNNLSTIKKIKASFKDIAKMEQVSTLNKTVPINFTKDLTQSLLERGDLDALSIVTNKIPIDNLKIPDIEIDAKTIRKIISTYNRTGKLELDSNTLKVLEAAINHSLTKAVADFNVPIKIRHAAVSLITKLCNSSSDNKVSLSTRIKDMLNTVSLEQLIKLLNCVADPGNLVETTIEVLSETLINDPANRRIALMVARTISRNRKITSRDLKFIYRESGLRDSVRDAEDFMINFALNLNRGKTEATPTEKADIVTAFKRNAVREDVERLNMNNDFKKLVEEARNASYDKTTKGLTELDKLLIVSKKTMKKGMKATKLSIARV